MLKKLQKRFVLINMCLVSAVLLVTFASLIISSANRLESDSYRSLEEDYSRIYSYDQFGLLQDTTQLDETIDQSGDPKKTPFDKQSSFRSFFVTLDSEGNIISTNDMNNALTEDAAQKAVTAALSQNKTNGVLNDLSLRYMIKLNENDERVIGFIDISFENTFISQQILNYSLIGVGSLICFFFISLILSHIAIKPIAKAWKQQQQFVADASHELKTPITVMLANTSILLSGKNLKDDEKLKWIHNIDLESRHMKKLVEDLLFLARVDSMEREKFHSKINLNDIVYESALPFEAVMFESGKQLEMDIAPDVHIKGDSIQIKQLVSILLDNAQKYAYENSKVTIRLRKDNNKAILSVNNLCEPIDQEDLPYIFDRFYRIDKARTRDKKSYGLGLAIAKEIVDVHNGKKFISSNKSGTTFIISLPLV